MHHPTCDDFWKVRNPDFTKIQVPVYSIGILHKVGIHLRGNIRGYETVTTPKKLLLCHGDFEGDEMAIFNSREMQLLHLRWYDHWLKGNDTGFMEEDPVTVFVRNREIYRPEKDWPLPQTQYKNLYLAPGPSGGVASLNDGLLTWEAPTAAYEPAPPAPAPGAAGERTGRDDGPAADRLGPGRHHGRRRDQGDGDARLDQLRLSRPGLVALLGTGDGRHGGRGTQPGAQDPHLRHRAAAKRTWR